LIPDGRNPVGGKAVLRALFLLILAAKASGTGGSDEMEKSDMEKLQILIKHWIEHNDEHAREFRKWVERAKSSGNIAVHDDILNAIENLGDATEHLREALEKL
jgi:hypothetical protein